MPNKRRQLQKNNINYQAKINKENEEKTYISLNANEIKKRISVYKTNFNSKPGDQKYHKHMNSTDQLKNTSIK